MYQLQLQLMLINPLKLLSMRHTLWFINIFSLIALLPFKDGFFSIGRQSTSSNATFRRIGAHTGTNFALKFIAYFVVQVCEDLAARNSRLIFAYFFMSRIHLVGYQSTN